MIDRRLILAGLLTGLAGCAANASRPATGRAIDTAWSDFEPPYVLFPGDELDIALPSAPELNRSVTVGPDGRISMPLIGHVSAADLSLPELETRVSQSLVPHLVRPAVEITLRRAAPSKVWIDGQVRTPGGYDLPGEAITVYQALLLAGGASVGARAGKAVLVRRGSDGQPMVRTLDLRAPAGNAPRARRGDIIFVPRNTVGEIGAYMTQVGDALPVGFSYALNGRWN